MPGSGIEREDGKATRTQKGVRRDMRRRCFTADETYKVAPCGSLCLYCGRICGLISMGGMGIFHSTRTRYSTRTAPSVELSCA